MNNYIPVLTLNKLVIFPNQEIKIDLSNEYSQKIVKLASKSYNDQVLVIAPKNSLELNPSIEDFPSIGVVAVVKSKLELSNGVLRIVLRGIKRTKIDKYFQNKNNHILKCTTEDVELPTFSSTKETAIRRKLITLVEEYIKENSNVSNSIVRQIRETNDLNILTDIIISFMPFSFSKKLAYMECYNPLNRANLLINDLNEEISINEIDRELDERLHETLENEQREYILKAKIQEINAELGNTKSEIINSYYEKLADLDLNQKILDKLSNEISRFSSCPDSSPESPVLKNYIETVLNLPWKNSSEDNDNIKEIENRLNESHYGLKEIKDRIIEFVSMRKKNPDLKSPIICLIGPPGVGKTSIAMSIANALNKEFVKVNVGGLNDSIELIGSRRTYLGAAPGKIMQGIIKCGVNNPVMLLDEVDKMAKDYKGDPAAVLLEALDETQNNYFMDNYIEEPFDLSKVLFILTANDKSEIPITILDRAEVFNLNSYTIYDKLSIAKDYLLPNITSMYNSSLKINKDVLEYIINNFTKEPGVRELKRLLEKIIRKVDVYEKNTKSVTKILVDKYIELKISNYLPQVRDFGITNILAYTTNGGVVSHVEVVQTNGSGKTHITGSAGDVLKESVEVIEGYLTSYYDYDFSNIDIYVHFLNSAQKKDGPSAGVAITVALLSCLRKKIIPSDIAFTGEISLKGDVLPVGGIVEKIISAKASGIKTIYIPEANMDDLVMLPIMALEDLTITPVRRFDEIYDALFK